LLLKGDLRLGTMIAFLFYVRDFFRPLEELADQSHLLQTAMASSERLFSLLDEPLVVENAPDARHIESFRGAVEFREVSFAYTPGTPVLEQISFRVDPGESLAIVGATGAGKTSIISLLARFYDVQEGEILVDGVNVKEYRQSELRQRVGMVLQDPVIFSGTIASNISLHHPDITREQIIEAAKYVNAHTFIIRLPDGYDSVTGERGANLSTGQKQLLALARALVQNPDILLVLDEATANVDTETERLIQQALQKLMQDRTTIVIAHRLSTIRNVDRILVMRKGALIESGTHSELVESGGYYRTLYELLSYSPV
jgi:ATP-binding cassette subfamily B multidrug efflux pump